MDMEIDIERSGGLARSLHIRLPAERMQAEKRTRFARLARTRQVPGFRRGHVPQALLEQEFGQTVEADALRHLIGASLSRALEEHALRPAATPQIADSRVAADGAVEFTVRFEVLPEIALEPLETLTVEQTVCEVREADLEAAIDTLLRKCTRLTPVERCATSEDWVEVRLAGAEGATEPPLRIDLGNPELPWDVREELVGALPGDRIQPARGAGKGPAFGAPEALQTLQVLQVLRAERPALDADFVAQLDIAGVSDPRQLRSWLRAELERKGARMANRRTRGAVLAALYAAHRQDLEVPECLLQETLRRMQGDAGEDAARSAAEAEREARKQAERELLLSAWVRHLGLRPQAARVRQFLEQAAAATADPRAARKSLRADPSWRKTFESMALEAQLVEKVLEHARVERRTRGYAELEQNLPAG